MGRAPLTVVLKGEPKSGKTYWAKQLVREMALNGLTVNIAYTEDELSKMSKEEDNVYILETYR